MDANALLHYLRGFAEHVDQPSTAQWTSLRNEILRASLTENQFIQVPVVNSAPVKPCNCTGETNGR